jgi:DNA invertase Pin-like site-specific DNA recombinase
MQKYNKITALYSRLSVGDEDRDGGESNSIQNQKSFLEDYAQKQQLINIKHYIDDDESGRFFDRSGYVQMMDDVESGKVSVCVMKDLTRWGRDYLQVGNAMETFRRNNVRFIAINHGIDSAEPTTLEFAPFINIMSEWYAKDISKKVTTGIKTKGLCGKPIMTEAPYGYVKDPDNKDYWLIDDEAAAVIRLIYALFMDGKNRNQICIHLKENQILTPTFYMKQQDRGTAKNRALNEANRYNWNKATVTTILTRQEYCGDVVNFKTAKHFKDKHSSYVDKSQWHITENVHEPIIDRTTFENVQRILENAPVKRPNGDGYIHPLSGLLFCKDCGAKLHIRTDHRYDQKRHIARCSEYAKGRGKNAQCDSQHQIDCDTLMESIASVLRKIAAYSLNNKAEFEALVKNSLAMQQTDETKKQQKRIPQITVRLEQINKVINKLYEDNALNAIEPDRYQQLSQKYSEEYYSLKKELEETQEYLSDHESASNRARKFIKLVESYCAFEEITPTAINEFISKIVVHERDSKGARQTIQYVEVHFNYIGRFENELTELAEPTEQELERMRAEIKEAQKEKVREYHRAYRKPYREKNIEKCREYERLKAREYRAKKKAQAAQ